MAKVPCKEVGKPPLKHRSYGAVLGAYTADLTPSLNPRRAEADRWQHVPPYARRQGHVPIARLAHSFVQCKVKPAIDCSTLPQTTITPVIRPNRALLQASGRCARPSRPGYRCLRGGGPGPGLPPRKADIQQPHLDDPAGGSGCADTKLAERPGSSVLLL